jgi:lysophospholipase L1-like esterase
MKLRKLCGLGALALTWIGIATSSAHAYHPRDISLMVGLGDSISAGALADTSTQNAWSIPWGLPFPSIDNPLDGIGFKSDFENKRTFSWVSGLRVHSHFRRLRSYLKPQGLRLWALNFAETGSISAMLNGQIREFGVAVKSGLFDSISYITLLVGANDLCKSVPLETFQQNVHGIFSQIAEISRKYEKPIRILVSSIPRIPDLGESRIQDYRTAAGYSCHAIRSTPFSYCRNMTQWSTEEEHQHLNRLVDQVNDILRIESVEASRTFPVLETHFSSGVSEGRLNPEDLAMDCFHPNASGQEKIADLLWREQPWFK